jgi:GT2 family glycosyltransferase
VVAPSTPRVRVVVIDHEGGDLTLRCLRHLAETVWPRDRLEIVLVDNGSEHSLVPEAMEVVPDLRVVRLDHNRGFAGGANAGIADLGETDYVALVNNDAFVESDWLRPLVTAISGEPQRGAATARIVFAAPFLTISLRLDSERADAPSSISITALRIDGDDVLASTRVASGRTAREMDREGATTTLRVHGSVDLVVPWKTSGAVVARGEIDVESRAAVSVDVEAGAGNSVVAARPGQSCIPFAVEQTPSSRLNNVGTCRNPDGSGFDRGFLEPDDGRYDVTEDVFAWSGTVALLKREYLDDVGEFDERLFAYYEDLDLALRGRARGWTYRYEPRAIAHHVHTATSHEGSDRFVFYNERNRLLVVARHDAPRRVVRGIGRYLVATLSYLRREAMGAVREMRPPRGRIVVLRLRAFASFLRLLPGTLRLRRGDAREAHVRER